MGENSLSQNLSTGGELELGDTEYGHEYIEYIFDMRNINSDKIKILKAR